MENSGEKSGKLRRSPDHFPRRPRARFNQIAFLRAFNALSSFVCAIQGRCSGQARGSDPGLFVLRHSNAAPHTTHVPCHTESSVRPPSFRTCGTYPWNSYENSRPYAACVTINRRSSLMVGRRFRSSGVLYTRPTAAINQELRTRQAPFASGPKLPWRGPHGIDLPLGHPGRERQGPLRLFQKKEVRRSPEHKGNQMDASRRSPEEVRVTENWNAA